MRRACPYCGSSEQRPGPARPALRYARCRRCGSGYVTEGISDLRAYYEEYDTPSGHDLPATVRARYLDKLALLAATVPGRRLPEVGCGDGHFLSVARGEGWEVCGTELSRIHAALATPDGLAGALRSARFEAIRLASRSLYLGEYRRALTGRPRGADAPLAAENAALRDRVERSALLSSLKRVANAALGATGLGESLECLARLAWESG